jgi:hypothetical protein
MNEDDLLGVTAPSPLPAAAARSAGLGMVALFAFLGFCAWRKFRR